MDPTAKVALELLERVPAGPAVLAAAERSDGLWLVGGAVRDALLGAPVRDLDIAVEGDVAALAQALGTVVSAHDRFGTAEVTTPDGGKVNLARTRAESYVHPGALPDVRPAGMEEDLRRRDFTLNAVAVGLSSGRRGEVLAAEHALEDVQTRTLRALHDRSFEDDPTRLLRLARYRSRLGLQVDPHTKRLARAAVEHGALGTVSGDRVGQELRLALKEPDPVAALAEIAGLAPALPRPDAAISRRALQLLPPGEGREDMVVLASGALGDPDGLEDRLRALGFARADVDLARAAADATRLAEQFGAAGRPSEIARAARERPVEAVALAGALGPVEQARAWLDDLRHVRLRITGHDLVRAGVPEGPEIGRRLERALAARLDGDLAGDDHDAELAAALA